MLFALLFIWIAVWAAILSLDKGKWLPTLGAFIRIVLLTVFVGTVIVYAIEHGVHGFGIGSFKPTYAVFIAAVPVLFFNYVGFELPSTAGEELKDPQRDVPFTVFRAGITTVLLYGAPVLAILLVLPTSQVTNLGGFIDAMKTVFTVYGGHVAANGSATLTGFGKVLGSASHPARRLHPGRCRPRPAWPGRGCAPAPARRDLRAVGTRRDDGLVSWRPP